MRKPVNKSLTIAKRFLFAAAMTLFFCLAFGLQAGVIFQTLYFFSGGNDGNFPQAGLMQGMDGNFYGTTAYGGTNGMGTVFKMTPSGALTSLYSFTDGADGEIPYDAMVQGNDGNLYGTSYVDGACFKITPLGVFAVLASPVNRPNGLTLANDGNFYGTTYYGGQNNAGTIFRLTTNGVYNALASFTGDNGSQPYAGLVQGTDGNFYGTTYSGGNPIFNGHTYVTYGAVFKFTTNGVITRLFSFNGSNGANPFAGLIQGNNGNFYGTTTGGGANGSGTVFKITPSGTFTLLHSFSKTTDGYDLEGGLMQASDGNFYGTTLGGGLNGGGGTVYQITPSGIFTVLFAFNGDNGSGSSSALIQGSDGNFYGTTTQGGTNGYGNIFRLTVPLQPILKPVAKVGNTLSLTWSSVSNLAYQVQYRNNLTETNWSNLGSTITATNGTTTITDPCGTTNRFYRVELLQ